MRPPLIKALKGLKNIKQYIRYAGHIEKLIRIGKTEKIPTELHRIIDSLTTDIESITKKTFQYNAVIISLYGILEQFIEGIIVEYLNQVNRTVEKYNNLPQKIIDNHVDYSANLIQNLKWSKKYQNLTSQEEIIENLHKCLSDVNYILNTVSFIQHQANIKHDVVIQLFGDIGIFELTNKFRSNTKFSDFIQKKTGITDLSQISNEVLFHLLNDLADRRNNVSHGIDENILSLNILQSTYIPFLECYFQVIYAILREETLQLYFDNHTSNFHEITPDSIIIIYDHKILCIKAENATFRVGNQILCKSAKGRIKLASIESIEVNKISYKEYEIVGSEDIGLQLNTKIKDNFTFYRVINPVSI